jgi:hypothetical protein
MTSVRANLMDDLAQLERARRTSAAAVKRSRVSYMQSVRLLCDDETGVITDLPVMWGAPVGSTAITTSQIAVAENSRTA